MKNPSKLNKEDVQILFADLQKQIVARSKTTSPHSLATSASVLAQLARLFTIPVILSVVPENNAAPELIAGLAEEVVGLPQFLRISASPFMDEKTKAAMAGVNRKTLIIAGFATEAVVFQAATDAVQQGYRVFVPVDACGGLSERTEAAAIRQIERFGGETTSVVSLATAIEPDFSTELGRQMMQVIQPLRLG